MRIGLGIGTIYDDVMGGALVPSWAVRAPDDTIADLTLGLARGMAYYDGVRQRLTDLLTVSNSGGYAEDLAGNLHWFAPNTLRRTNKGALIELTKTNLFLNSEAPVTQDIEVTAQAYTLSFYGTGTVTLSGASSAGPLTGAGGATTRSTLTFTPSAGTLTLTLSGNPQRVQLEAGSFASSYFPAAEVAATRNSDLVFMPAAGLYTQAATLYVRSLPLFVASSDVRSMAGFAIGSGTSASLRIITFNGNYRGVIRSAAANSMDSVVGSGEAGSWSKNAFGYDADGGAVSCRGAEVVSDSSVTIPSVDDMHNLYLGSIAGGLNVADAWISDVGYFRNTKLSNADLQALSAA